MKRLVYIILSACVACSCLLSLDACKKEEKGVISSGKMEDVLYDYYVAQGLIDQMNSDERTKNAQAYVEAVFRKHNITEAEFDSSLLYYNRNSKALNKIYKNLQERFTEDNLKLQQEGGSNEMLVLTENGDTANIWSSTPLLVLRPAEQLSHQSFTLKAASSFLRRDTYVLQFNSVFAKENSSDRNCRLHAGLSVTYKNGKTIGTTTQCTVTMPISLRLKAEDNEDIDNVNVFFYYAGSKECRNLAFVKDIMLIRMHSQESPDAYADTIKVDSVKTDSSKVRHNSIHLTPEQLREQNQGEERIRIKTAPDVRTPNSFGTRRRKPARQARPTN